VLPDDEAVLAEAKTMYTRLFVGDRLCYYTKERWIGSSNGHYMAFSNWNTALCEAIWLAYQEWQREEDRQTRPPSFASEVEMTIALLGLLSREGWVCETQYLTPYGRADILATMGARQALIEVKLMTDGNTLNAALGQLLAYGLATPTVELWLAVPRPVPSKFLTLFDHYTIKVREVTCLTTVQPV
jgi:Holliday junction resolvase-like predicted endonuclease